MARLLGSLYRAGAVVAARDGRMNDLGEIAANAATSQTVWNDPTATTESPDWLEVDSWAETGVTLPGMASSGPGCGEWYPREFCGDCAHLHLGVHRCGQRGCPDCWWQWAKDRAEGITVRLSRAREAQPPGFKRRVVHVVASPPEGEVQSLEQFYDGHRTGYKLAQDAGVRGGVMIPHGFRVREDVKQDWRSGPSQEFEGGIWKWIRMERPENWRALTYWSPHYHIIGLAEDVGQLAEDDRDGWVVKRVNRSFAPHQLHNHEGYKDLINVSLYLLSHATYEPEERKQVVRWFGSCAPAAMTDLGLTQTAENKIETTVAELLENKPDLEDDDEDRECEDCGSTNLYDIWHAQEALQDPRFCDQMPRERVQRLQAAFEWAVGEVVPPPGLKGPRSREHALEALEALVASR